MNVIVIVSDTLRRDYLGCYGNKWIHTENLDSLARESLVFDRYHTASFPTMPNRADFFTGRWTLNYLGWSPLLNDEVLLPEILRDAGYRTKAVVDLPVGHFFIGTGYNYDRGFLDFENIRGQGKERDDMNMQRRYETDYCAPSTMIAATQWLERHYKEKFFLYIDTWDPHEPWDPPSWYGEMYCPKFKSEITGFDTMVEYEELREKIRIITGGQRNKKMGKLGIRTTTGLGATQVSKISKDIEDILSRLRALYAGEVTMVDRWVGVLLEKIGDMGLFDNTLVIFTTDHGTYLGEHDYVHKRAHIYEEVGHIPLIMRLPDSYSDSHAHCDAVVQPPDLMPTILEFTEVGLPKTVQGTSLIPLARNEVQKIHELAVSSQAIIQANRITASFEEWTIISDYKNVNPELYNLQEDPKQIHNLYDEKKDLYEELHLKTIGFLESKGASEELLKGWRH